MAKKADGTATLKNGVKTAKFKSFDAFSGNVLAEAAVSFVIERSKAEINIAFVQRFQTFLDKNPEARILFPSTLAQTKDIQSFQFNEFLNSIKQALLSDLQKFPEDVSQVLSLPKYQDLLTEFPEIRAILGSLSALNKIKDNDYHPARIISDIAALPEMNGKTGTNALQNLGNAWQLINIVSMSLVDPVQRSYLVTDPSAPTKSDFQKLVGDASILKKYYEALCDKIIAADIVFQKDDGSLVYLKNLPFFKKTDYDTKNKYIFINLVQNVTNAAYNFENVKSSNGLKNQDKIVAYMSAAGGCIESFNQVCKTMGVPVEADQCLAMASTGIKIYKDAESKDWNSLVNHSINFLDFTFDLIQTATSAHVSDLQAKGSPAKKGDVIQAKSLDKKVGDGLKVTSQLLKWANLGASLVTAKNADEAKKAIESAALPPGSSSIKKNSNFNISLQTHLGIGYNFYTSGRA